MGAGRGVPLGSPRGLYSLPGDFSKFLSKKCVVLCILLRKTTEIGTGGSLIHP